MIAVVDDEEPVRRALRRLLGSAGYQTALFPSGQEFLDSLAGRRPDCIILDLHMPNVDGFAVLEELARSSLRLPVIIITGYEKPEARERIDHRGISAFLRKPIDGQHLVDTIQEALRCA